MRLVATEYLSLDGVFEEPGRWSIPFFNDEAGQFKNEELQSADALLLGRTTYEGFASAWPTMRDADADADAFGDKMNTMPKYVVTSSSEELTWSGAERLEGDPVDAVRALKARPGNDLLLAGSAQLFTTLSNAGLIDLYRLMIHPIILGSGQRLFLDETARRTLALTRSRSLASGIVIAEYEPAA